MSFLRSSRGQFFSPDVLIASSVFIFALILFFSASNSIYYQQAIFADEKKIDETAHNVLNVLILSSGQPSNWENGSISDVNSIGLALSNNELSVSKTLALITALSNPSDYAIVQHKLGLGQYSLYFRVLTLQGAPIFYAGVPVEGGLVVDNPKIKHSYKRFVIFDGSASVLEVVFSLKS